MVRSKWVTSLMAALASTGLALAQQGDRIITIAEPGKPVHKCKVLETWNKPDGTVVYRVKDLVTGDVFPIEEPPSGSPIVPAAATTTSVPAPAAAPAKLITVTEAGQAPQQARIVQSWRMADGHRAYQVQAVATGEMMTIVESGPTSAPSAGTPAKAIATRILHWGNSSTPPRDAPLPPTMVVQNPVPATPDTAAKPLPRTNAWSPAASVVAPQPTTPYASTSPPAPMVAVTQSPSSSGTQLPAAWTPPSRTTGTTSTASAGSTSTDRVAVTPSPKATGVAAKPSPTTTTLNPKLEDWKPTAPVQVAQVPSAQTISVQAQASAVPSKPTVETAQPSDWRQMWGKTDSTSKPSTSRVVDARPTDAGKMALPPVVKVDPLTDPVQYTRKPVEEKASPSAQVTRAMPAQTLTSPSTPVTRALPSLPPATPAVPMVAKTDSGMHLPPATSGTPTAQPTEPQIPLGARSVIDAGGNPRYIPTSAVTLPPDRPTPPTPPTLPAPAASTKASTPSQGENDMVNAFTPAAPNTPPPGTGGPTANAFSPAATPPEPAKPGPGSAYAAQPYGPTGYGPGYPTMARTMPPSAPSAFPRPMLPPSPAMPLASPPSTPVAQAAYYPNVAAANPAPMGYPSTMGAAGTPMAAQPIPSGTEAQLPGRGSMNTAEMTTMLHESLLPSQREWAAEQLAGCDWRMNQPVVDALLKACRDDPAPTVRASCVRSLASMNVNLVPVVETLRGLKSDTDPRVQTEVEQALTRLGSH